MKPVVTIALILFVAYGCATTPPPVEKPETLHGIASWYGEEFAGRTTANGEIFDPLQLTAAHRTLPFGTVLDVRNSKTGQTVRVRVNDRGPFVGNRLIDLSYAAAQKISLIEPGSGDVDLAIVSLGRGDREPPVPYDVNIAGSAGAPKTTVSSADAPAVEFPLPTEVTLKAPASSPAPTSAASTSEADFRVQVVEERAGVETRRQVSPDGKTIETVPVGEASAAPKAADTPAAPGHSAAAKVDRVPQPRVETVKGPVKFYVQVGAFSVEANANALRDRLTRIGEKSQVTRADDLYKVRIGPFATRDQALATRTTLESKGISAMIVAE